MKKVLLLLLLILSTGFAKAQMITAEDIERVVAQTYGVQPETGKEYMALADRLVSQYPLDMNNQLTFTSIIEVPGKTKDQIYVSLHSWFVSSFNSGKSAVQMADKEQGVILAKGYLSGVGSRVGFSKSVVVGAYIVIRLDIKDEKVRLITSIQEYYMETSVGVGQILFGGTAPKDITIPVYLGYPFDSNKYKMYKRETAIGYVGGIVYSQILKNKVQNAINFGLTGTDNSNW